METARIHARDAAVRRLRRLTAASVAAFGVLGLVFALFAAKAFPGRSPHPVVRQTAERRTTPARRQTAQTAPPLTQIGSEAQPSPTPASPSPAPAPAAAPAAAVSGGS